MQADLLKAADDFGKSLQAMVDAAEADYHSIIKKAIFDLLSELMEENPKDTHRCAASWMVGPNWTDWEEPPGDYRGVDLGAKAQQIVDALPDSDVYCLYNNIEYLMALEDGHSQKQSPTGFIANAMSAFAQHVQKAAQERGYTS